MPLAAFGRDGAQLPLAILLDLSVALGDAGVEEGLFGAGERQRGGGGPAVHLFEAAASQEVRLGAVGREPFAHRLRESPLIEHVVACVDDPVVQPGPFGEQRLVRDLDRRAPRHRVAVEAQQPVATERVEHRAEHPAIDRELLELALEDSATGVVGSLSEGDESQEHLSRDVVRLVAEPGQQAFGALHQRTRHPAELSIRGVGDPDAPPLVEQLRQRVLQQRQRAGPVHHVSDQLGHERRLERDAVLLDGAGDRPLQLVRGHRR